MYEHYDDHNQAECLKECLIHNHLMPTTVLNILNSFLPRSSAYFSSAAHYSI